MNLLEIKNVEKKFGGKTVLDGLNLSVPEGSIFGFVGENGAGKTTTMKLILGLEEVTTGEITINKEPVIFGHTKTNHYTGYLPDVPEFYGYMRGREYLQLCGEITGIPKQKLAAKMEEMLELVGLAAEKKFIRSYSRGMKQRLGIAQALLNEPRLLICDEPTSALDPSGRQEFLALLASLRGKVTILFSTHILSDVERICDYVGILHQGKLAVSSPLATLKELHAHRQIEILVEKQQDKLIELLQTLQQQHLIQSFSQKEEAVVIRYEGSYEELLPHLFRGFMEKKITPEMLRKVEPSLEQIFLEVIK